MTTLFWVLIVLHVFLCFFLALLVLVQNDKMGGLAGLGGMDFAICIFYRRRSDLHPEVDPCRCCDFLHRGFRSRPHHG